MIFSEGGRWASPAFPATLNHPLDRTGNSVGFFMSRSLACRPPITVVNNLSYLQCISMSSPKPLDSIKFVIIKATPLNRLLMESNDYRNRFNTTKQKGG